MSDSCSVGRLADGGSGGLTKTSQRWEGEKANVMDEAESRGQVPYEDWVAVEVGEGNRDCDDVIFSSSSPKNGRALVKTQTNNHAQDVLTHNSSPSPILPNRRQRDYSQRSWRLYCASPPVTEGY